MRGISPSNFIKPEALGEIQAHIIKLEEAIHEDNLLTSAGHPDAARTKNLRETLEKLKLFKTVYFPGQ